MNDSDILDSEHGKLLSFEVQHIQVITTDQFGPIDIALQDVYS
jgi:hypothetical protein